MRVVCVNYLAVLQDVTVCLGGGHQLQSTLSTAMNMLVEKLPIDAAGLMVDLPNLLEPDQRFGDKSLLFSSEAALVRAAYRHPQMSYITAPEQLRPGAAWMILVPLSGSQTVPGVLQVVAKTDYDWGEDGMTTLQTIGCQLGIALENAHRFFHMERQAKELEWLNKVGDSMLSLISSLKIDEVAERIMNATRHLLQVEETSILLKDYETDELILWSHTPTERDLSIRLKPGQGIAGWVYEYSQPAIVNDVRTDPRWEDAVDAVADFQTRSLLAVPIILDSEVVGVVEAVNKVHDDFNEQDLGILTTLAKWASIAIGNAITYDKLQRTTEQLADAKKQAAMAHMVLNLGHKINNSVGAMRVWGLELREEVRAISENATKQYVDNMLANAEETLQMVRRIRSATTLRVGDIRAVDIVDTVESSLQFTRLMPDITITRHFEPGLPRIGADNERLIEAFLHLINNAADAMGTQGTLTLTCRLAQNGTVEALVQDTGPGVPEHLRSRIFDPFVTTKPDGMGLGLWMVKVYIELIGGKITMSSIPEKGSTFRVSLPPWEKE